MPPRLSGEFMLWLYLIKRSSPMIKYLNRQLICVYSTLVFDRNNVLANLVAATFSQLVHINTCTWRQVRKNTSTDTNFAAVWSLFVACNGFGSITLKSPLSFFFVQEAQLLAIFLFAFVNLFSLTNFFFLLVLCLLLRVSRTLSLHESKYLQIIEAITRSHALSVTEVYMLLSVSVIRKIWDRYLFIITWSQIPFFIPEIVGLCWHRQSAVSD